MRMYINIAAFTLLMTRAISLGSVFGIILCAAGFLLMMLFIEELEEKEYQISYDKLKRKIEQEASWQNREPNLENQDTSR
jgi:hypothetical protein